MKSVENICVLGGTGFVGRHLVTQLADAGKNVTLLTRSRERRRDLMVLPRVQIKEANINDPAQLAAHFQHCDSVVNLIGILNESGKTTFQHAHVELPRIVVQAANQSGVKRLLHMSALHADAQRGPSQYLESKGKGEDLVHATSKLNLQVTSFRPSVMFGPDDSFINRFAALLAVSPVFPLACPQAKFAPIYIGDVVQAMLKTLENRAYYGKRLDLCGPKIYTLQEIVEYIAKLSGKSRKIIGLGPRLSHWQAVLAEKLPGKPFSTDNLRSLQVDSVCRKNDLATLGITPTEMEAVVPAFLAGQNERAKLQIFRTYARRN